MVAQRAKSRQGVKRTAVFLYFFAFACLCGKPPPLTTFGGCAFGWVRPKGRRTTVAFKIKVKKGAKMKSKKQVHGTNKAVIYARYSSEKQSEMSVTGQVREVRAFAEQQGYTIIGEYIDRALTGKVDTQKQIDNFLIAIGQGIITTNTKQKMLELESEKADLEQRIDNEKLNKPLKLEYNQVYFWFSQFTNGDTTNEQFREKIFVKINDLL
jgi:hypothetical protein